MKWLRSLMFSMPARLLHLGRCWQRGGVPGREVLAAGALQQRGIVDHGALVFGGVCWFEEK
jgi:hypothetical protein